jgi:Family of unknown function (DUF5706)
MAKEGDASVPSPQPSGLEYTRRLYANVLDWYNSAERKAQVVLGFNGVFISLLGGSVFVKGADLHAITTDFGVETWVFLSLMTLCLLLATLATGLVLVPRMSRRRILAALREHGNGGTYQPEVIWFFRMIGYLDEGPFKDRLRDVSPDDEVRALGSQIHRLSVNVTRKHLWVNVAFAMTASVFVFFLAAAISYLLNVT